jgi:integrase/recombinase XerD
VKFYDAIDLYLADMKAEGRLSSSGRSERGYRSTLIVHANDVGNRDPRYVGVDDVRRTLAHWPNPNTRSVNRAKLMSFYRWAVAEKLRRDNPVEGTRPSKRRPQPYRHLNGAEMLAMLDAATGTREVRAVSLLLLAGLRRDELLGLQGRHFERHGRVWVSADIAKGGREREVPVLPDLASVVDEIRASVASDEYVIPAQRWRDPGRNRERGDLAQRRSSPQALGKLLAEVAKRAGVSGRVTAHSLRYSFADLIAASCAVRTAQQVLGHANIATTQIYLSKPRFDDLAGAVKAVTLGAASRTNVLGVAEALKTALEATTGIEPV